MRGWRNNLILSTLWVGYVLFAMVWIPSWLLVFSVIYLCVGDIVCHVMHIRSPIDATRFDLRGTLRTIYWLLWWPWLATAGGER
jgi:hypothetical protein